MYKVNEIYESDFSNNEGEKAVLPEKKVRITNVLNDQDQVAINKGLLEKVRK